VRRYGRAEIEIREEQMFILAGEMYVNSCYFIEGTSMLWQAIKE
jgi:hypothetical protein